MATTHALSIRTANATNVQNHMDQGSGPGKVRFFNAGKTTLLAEIICDAPCGTVTDGVLTLSGFPKTDNAIDNSGTAAIVELTDSDNNVAVSGAVTENGGGGEVELASSDPGSLNFVKDEIFTVNVITYTAPV